jgi:hypothetical protein
MRQFPPACAWQLRYLLSGFGLFSLSPDDVLAGGQRRGVLSVDVAIIHGNFGGELFSLFPADGLSAIINPCPLCLRG